MTIGDLKDLKALLKVCRENGVSAVKIDGMELTLDLSAPVGAAAKRQAKALVETGELPPFGELSAEDRVDLNGQLTPEQLLFYSSVPHDQLIDTTQGDQ